LFYTEELTTLRRAMRKKGLPEVRFRFDYDGSKIVVND
jgi:D-glycero-alpha-D-manno-heptose-7-phosphate kinase